MDVPDSIAKPSASLVRWGWGQHHNLATIFFFFGDSLVSSSLSLTSFASLFLYFPSGIKALWSVQFSWSHSFTVTRHSLEVWLCVKHLQVLTPSSTLLKTFVCFILIQSLHRPSVALIISEEDIHSLHCLHFAEGLGIPAYKRQEAQSRCYGADSHSLRGPMPGRACQGPSGLIAVLWCTHQSGSTPTPRALVKWPLTPLIRMIQMKAGAGAVTAIQTPTWNLRFSRCLKLRQLQRHQLLF